MSHANSIRSVIRTAYRSCAAALASLVAAISAYGASLPPSL